MKPVVHIITTISRGGAENQLLTLASEQVLEGRQVTVIFLKDLPELAFEFEKSGVLVEKFAHGLNPVKQIIEIRKYLRLKNVIVHAHLPRAELIAAVATKKHKFIVSRHNSEKFFPKGPDFLSAWISRYVVRKASCCIAISYAVADFMLFKNEIPSLEKVKVIHYGIDKNRILGPRDLSSSKSILKLGTIARVVPQKDYPTLLRSFALVLMKLPNCTLSILGDGPELDKMKNLANSLGIQDKVVWCGKSEMVDNFLRNLDLFILTSVYEGFGLVLLEAMANRTPIIAADNSAIPEVIGKDSRYLFKTGDFDELSEKIIDSLSLDRRTELVRIQSSRLSMFDSKTMSSKVNLIYSQESPAFKLQ